MGTREPADPIYSALEIFSKIAEEANRSNAGSKLRARAREVIGLIEEAGLVPTLSFFYSKKDKEAEKGYELMLRAILEYLKKLNIITKNVETLLSNHNEMIETLKELRGKSSIISPLLRPFLIEFKRLCEALWEEER